MSRAKIAAGPGLPPTCMTCMYSGHETPNPGQQMKPGERPKLRCRRYPPNLWVFMTPSPIAGAKPMLLDLSIFPETEPQWLCGEYEVNQ